jgi:hypothetical protein
VKGLAPGRFVLAFATISTHELPTIEVERQSIREPVLARLERSESDLRCPQKRWLSISKPEYQRTASRPQRPAADEEVLSRTEDGDPMTEPDSRT